MGLFSFFKRSKDPVIIQQVQEYQIAMHVWISTGQRFTILVKAPYTSRPGDELLNSALAAADRHPLVNGKLLNGTPASNFRNSNLRGAIMLPGMTLSKLYTLER